MLDIMMHSGGYRIDYLNLDAAGSTQAFGFYVCGELEGDQPYSSQARHHFLAGMHWITCTRNLDNLVAVYLDICSGTDQVRPGWQQLAKDLSAGLFKRVMICSSESVINSAIGNLNGHEWITIQPARAEENCGQLSRTKPNELSHCGFVN